MTVAPGIKKIPNPTAIGLESRWLTPMGSVVKVPGADLLTTDVRQIARMSPKDIRNLALANKKPPITGSTIIRINVKGIERFRLDIGKLPPDSGIPQALRGKVRLHYHRVDVDPATGNIIKKSLRQHRPYQNGRFPKW
jgi:hypothetical protein